ncbi:MAG: spore gernimation protein [Firmicutes bacterium HGW-Firmicutes-1]|jgi:spore germination protein KB|nr:MAG: spore gernimation protein [Firmicutes bacterium HGW-Firmicutes-1]
MEKEIVTNKQVICLMILFIMGSTLVLGVGAEAKQDSWIAILTATAVAIMIVLIYSRILWLFPGKDLFQILELILGKYVGKVVSLLFIWYAFHLGVLVIRNFSEFMKVVALLETPELVSALILVLLCIWGVKEGIEVLGRWSQFVLPLLLAIILTTIILSLKMADWTNIRPIMYNSFGPITKAAFSVFSFPFAETVVFMMILSGAKDQKGYYMIYLKSILIGGLIVLIINIRNIVVVGHEFITNTAFPSYAAVSLINVGEFLQRIEILVSVVFLFAGFIKISICLLAVSNGVARVLNITQYRTLVTPIGLIMLSLSLIIYDSIMEMQEWAFIYYKFYALPFQVIMPVIIWSLCEIKVKRGETKKLAKNA